MPLPPTQYLDAGPGVPMASASVAVEQSEAFARMGNTIAAVGERAFAVAERVRKIEETGKLSAFFSNLDEEASQFSQELMTRSDTAAWPAEWRERTVAMRERMKELGLSPEGMARAEAEFGDWSTQRSIGFETQSATKALQMGRAQVGNALKYYGARGDRDSYMRELNRGRESGVVDPVEYDAALRDFDSIEAQNLLIERIQEDPAGALADLESGDFLKTHPGATTAMVERGRREAETRLRAVQVEASGTLMDEIAAGTLTDPAAVEERAKGLGLRPRQVEILKGEAEDRKNAEAMAQRATPDYQNMVIGEISAQLAELDPTDSDRAVQVDALIRQLPAGANKSHWRAQLQRKLAGDPEDDTALGINLKLADEAFQQGWFGKPPEISTADAIDAGFLKDQGKLTALGFSEEQAASIIEAKSDTERKNLFQAEWTKRGKAAPDVDPLTWATAEAIRSGADRATVPEDPAARWARVKNYGAVKAETIKWARANPKATADEIRAKMIELAAPGRREAFVESVFDPGVAPDPAALTLPGSPAMASDALLPSKP